MLGAMSTPAVPMTDEPPAITLVIGPEEFLAERAVARVLAGVRAADGEADVHDLSAGSFGAGMLATLTSPSLFATKSAVVVRDVQDLSQGVMAELISYMADPVPSVALVLVHKGSAGVRGWSMRRGRPVLRWSSARRFDGTRTRSPLFVRKYARRGGS